MNTEEQEKQLELIFGEALGDRPTARETQEAWQAFVRRRDSHRRHNLRIIIAGMAAACVALAFILLPLFKQESQEIEVFAALPSPAEITVKEEGGTVIVKTPPATTTSVQLSDGSHVLLGANSCLEYSKQFADAQRCVVLRGEARFQVAKDSLRPFVVNTDRWQARVLGTVFDVSDYPNCPSSVTLYEGKVSVSHPSRKQLVFQEMHPGEQASQDETGVIRLTPTDVEYQSKWTENAFFFDNTELERVMQEIGSWYNVGVLFRSRSLLDERIYFRMSRQVSVQTLVDALNDLEIARFSIERERIVVAALSETVQQESNQ